MNNVPLGPSAEPAPQPNDHWYGIVRNPIPGVEIIPMMRSHVMGGLVPISEVARSFAVTGINVLEARKNWRNSGAVYMSDELEEAFEAYHALEDEIEALPAPSLGSLLAHSIQVTCLAGEESIKRGWVTPAELTWIWNAIPPLHDAHRFHAWLTSQVTAAWTDAGHQMPETTYDPLTGHVVLDGLALSRDELLAGIHTAAIGTEAIALALIRIDKSFALACVLPCDA